MNENTNGLIRQYFPKGTDFRDISHAEKAPGGKIDSTTAPAHVSTSEPQPKFSSRKIRPPVARSPIGEIVR